MHIQRENPILPEIIINIAYIALITSTPLLRWMTASHVMLEKGKGKFIENLRIIQLVEADLTLYYTKYGDIA